jgi:hypothetical protein
VASRGVQASDPEGRGPLGGSIAYMIPTVLVRRLVRTIMVGSGVSSSAAVVARLMPQCCIQSSLPPQRPWGDRTLASPDERAEPEVHGQVEVEDALGLLQGQTPQLSPEHRTLGGPFLHARHVPPAREALAEEGALL